MTQEGRRTVELEQRFREDLTHRIRTDRRVALRVMELTEAILRDPFRGIGKPEPLRGVGPNTWSRRIDDEHRLVCVVERDRIVLVQARYPYER